MKILLLSMPDAAPPILHPSAIHMPALGIASVAGNIDPGHEVRIADLVRKRSGIARYVTRVLQRFRPDLVGFSAMTWQYPTCVRLMRLVRERCPTAKTVLGGYHATLMGEEVAEGPEAELLDFIVRGEGEDACRRLVNALDGQDRFEEIPSLSFKRDCRFVHNPRSAPLDLETIKPPVRDRRRLTWGYHYVYMKMEVLETSRGCTRDCNFCSMRHMYGRTFRPYPVERVIADLDDIVVRRRCRKVFIVDDNWVLNPRRVIELCDAIIARRYRGLRLIVQADCVSMARNEAMVKRMAEAGFVSVFLGIESASPKNLAAARKGDIVSASQEAVAMCHRYGISVIGGLIFGFPDDDEEAIVRNYRFLNTVGTDAPYCQIMTPYPKTGMRRELMEQGLVTNPDDFSRYNGLWANVRTRHLSTDELQYLFWLHRQRELDWWKPSSYAQRRGRGALWMAFWTRVMMPVLKRYHARVLRREGLRGRYKRELRRLTRMNRFPDLDPWGPDPFDEQTGRLDEEVTIGASAPAGGGS